MVKLFSAPDTDFLILTLNGEEFLVRTGRLEECLSVLFSDLAGSRKLEPIPVPVLVDGEEIYSFRLINTTCQDVKIMPTSPDFCKDVLGPHRALKAREAWLEVNTEIPRDTIRAKAIEQLSEFTNEDLACAKDPEEAREEILRTLLPRALRRGVEDDD